MNNYVKYTVQGYKQLFYRVSVPLPKEDLKTLYDKCGGVITVETELDGHKNISRLIKIEPNEDDPTTGQYKDINAQIYANYQNQDGIIKIDLPVDEPTNLQATIGQPIEHNFKIHILGDHIYTQTNWNDTYETNIFINEEDNEPDAQPSKPKRPRQGKVPTKEMMQAIQDAEENWKTIELMVSLEHLKAKELFEKRETIVTVGFQRTDEGLLVITKFDNRGTRRTNYKQWMAEKRILKDCDQHPMLNYFFKGKYI